MKKKIVGILAAAVIGTTAFATVASGGKRNDQCNFP